MGSSIICGIIYFNQEYVEVYCNQVTGECYFQDPFTGWDFLIGEVSLDRPVLINPQEIIENLMNGVYDECIGLICGSDYVIKLIDECTATKADPFDPCTNIGDIWTIDLDSEYEE